MRITFGSGYDVAMADLSKVATGLARRQREVSSGKRVNTPSDDPSAAAEALRERAEQESIDQYTRTAESVSSRLAVVDTVLSDIIDKLTSAQSAATAAKGTTQTDSQREATAAQLEGLRDALLSDMNATFSGRYLFSGAESLTAPYTATGGTVSTYQGDANGMSVDIGHDRSVQVTFDGESITKGSDAQDIFQVLDALIAAVRANDQDGVSAGLTALGSAFRRVTSVQSGIGSSMNAIEDQLSRLGDLKLASKTRLSKAEDANMAESITQMNQATTVYKAALGAVSTRNQLSLFDYLG